MQYTNLTRTGNLLRCTPRNWPSASYHTRTLAVHTRVCIVSSSVGVGRGVN